MVFHSVEPINVHGGSPAAEFPMDDVKLIHFHDFASLPTTAGKTTVESPEFSCAGYKWRLRLTQKNTTAVALKLCTKDTIVDAAFTVNLKSLDGSNFDTPMNTAGTYYKFISDGHYRTLFLHTTRYQIKQDLDSFEEYGTLTFEVRIRLHHDYYSHDDKPQSSLSDNMFNQFLSETGEDVAFKVGGNIMKAHRAVLKAHVPELAELCESYSLSNPMPVDDVKPEIFQLMLDYVYEKAEPSPETWGEQSGYILDSTKQNQSILYAASKYGFSALKSKAEAWCVKFINLEVDNVIQYLLHADGNDLQLLKEATIKFITDHGDDVMQSESFPLLDESPALGKEVMKACFQRINYLKQSLKRKRNE